MDHGSSGPPISHRPTSRQPAVAGSFYPRSPERLAAMVDELISNARRPSSRRSPLDRRLRGLVVPHAGYMYSGPVAASAYAELASRPHPSGVILLCPSHFWPLEGFAVPTHATWATPLGDVVIDESAREAALAAGARADDAAHRSEHSAEVQLPFLQRLLPGVSVLPIAAGPGDPEAGADLVATLMGPDTLLLVSTDLSHYHDVGTAERLDARTVTAILGCDPTRVGHEDACGADGLRTSMAWARRAGHGFRLLDRRTSAETAGDRRRVVGYAALALEQTAGSDR